jgi:hypothetical protein
MIEALVSGRSVLWWVNQGGIALEVVGAMLIVVAAFRTRGRIKYIADTWDAALAEKLRDVISDQAYTELRGFALLAIGLLCQMIGGFE